MSDMESMNPKDIFPKLFKKGGIFAAFTTRPSPMSHIDKWLIPTLDRVPSHEDEVVIYIATGVHLQKHVLRRQFRQYLEVQGSTWRLRYFHRISFAVERYPKSKEDKELSRNGYLFTFGRFSLMDMTDIEDGDGDYDNSSE